MGTKVAEPGQAEKILRRAWPTSSANRASGRCQCSRAAGAAESRWPGLRPGSPLRLVPATNHRTSRTLAAPRPGQGHGGFQSWIGPEAAALLPHLKVAW